MKETNSNISLVVQPTLVVDRMKAKLTNEATNASTGGRGTSLRCGLNLWSLRALEQFDSIKGDK